MEKFDFVEMKVPAKAEYVGVIRLSISGIANRMGFSYEDIEDLKVAISEAITNTVTHAYNEKDEGEVTIGFGIYEDRLEIMVADHGGSFDLNKIKDDIGPYKNTESVESLREGGFGLFLINALMDKVEISNNYGVIVLMTKYLSEAEVGFDDDQISTTQ
ncbi:anti-sigma B factor RsbW [Virgibacillus halodenitrificans]|jgi:serine/threonine-protein kinase RsbW|uniref:Serine-protein kinase RsbW n=1 Tax=Virgibacillus halodenitrificans TaxID=1482 RepID=A0AAC9NJT0_VIRHA|nr:anti-sigma B factor RsbW [Virgibacillus halodenitrificans]APC47110.1 anti-sigma B factor RsbW [Virgibacillus halodenitrificans]MBD1223162.1 anti-sigma B factor RsbW [Virgibacillus halodenitrificans]MCG1027285.1 anti-sigma B factor RsbW [Virgibacillus halodenitrificans]MCJ0930418.1 anti-sigma B factor RsbW [Virgibacillus halodenitrificans]MEC2159213.1 anti-sigma B factor RsbW [Virgibacillus halodenitrificans]